jgi:hypothetical protein
MTCKHNRPQPTDQRPTSASTERRKNAGRFSDVGTISLAVCCLVLRVPYASCAEQTPQIARNVAVRVSGELKQWHKVTLTIDGPAAQESDDPMNPFLDY